MVTFNPQPCPCGCKKWIMSPWFGCQCSSLSTAEKDELMDMARDAERYRHGEFVEERAANFLRRLGYTVIPPNVISTNTKLQNLVGRVFDRLTVISEAPRVRGKSRWRTRWLCRCACGNEKIVDGADLKSGKTKSCGCLNQENRRRRRGFSFFRSKLNAP